MAASKKEIKKQIKEEFRFNIPGLMKHLEEEQALLRRSKTSLGFQMANERIKLWKTIIAELQKEQGVGK